MTSPFFTRQPVEEIEREFRVPPSVEKFFTELCDQRIFDIQERQRYRERHLQMKLDEKDALIRELQQQNADLRGLLAFSQRSPPPQPPRPDQFDIDNELFPAFYVPSSASVPRRYITGRDTPSTSPVRAQRQPLQERQRRSKRSVSFQ